MTDFRIIFDGDNITLPDGACLGVQGEHLATQLLIQLPSSLLAASDMFAIQFTIDETEVRTPTIYTSPNEYGAFVKDGVIHFPLTRDYTFGQLMCMTVVSVQRIGSAESIVDSTVPVHGLYFLDSHGVAPKPEMADHIAEQLYRQMVNQGVYRARHYSDLFKFPCNRAQEGDYVDVLLSEYRKTEPEVVPIAVGDFCPIVFFNPSPRFPWEHFPNAETFPLTGIMAEHPPKERIVFERGDTTYTLSLEYSKDAGAYLVFYRIHSEWTEEVQISDGEATTTEEVQREQNSLYIYTPKTCEITIEDTLCLIRNGWNRLMYDDMQIPYFDGDTQPDCITDVTCIEIHTDIPGEVFGTTILRHISQVFCQNYPYVQEFPKGKYVFTHGSWHLSTMPRIGYAQIPSTREMKSDTFTVTCEAASDLDTAAPVHESKLDCIEVVKSGNGWITIRVDRTKYTNRGSASVPFVFVRGSHRTAKQLIEIYYKWLAAGKILEVKE